MKISPFFRVASCFLLVLFLTGCTKKLMQQRTSSMEPTIKRSEMVKVDQEIYATSNPQRWDVIAYQPTGRRAKPAMLRIAGLPGEVVEFRSDGLYIDDRKEEPSAHLKVGPYVLIKDGLVTTEYPLIKFPYTVPEDSYFVLGDNMAEALDSRYLGGLHKYRIIGKVLDK